MLAMAYRCKAVSYAEMNYEYMAISDIKFLTGTK